MLSILFRVEVRPDKREEFIAFIEEDIRVARGKEPGTLRFDLIPDRRDMNAFYCLEEYEDEPAFKKHQHNDPYKIWLTKIMPEMVTTFQLLFEGQPLRSLSSTLP